LERKERTDFFQHQGITKYELARVLGARALQLSMGAPPLVKVTLDESLIDIARRELEAGMLPVIIRRRMPDGQMQDVPLQHLMEQSKSTDLAPSQGLLRGAG